LATAANYSVLGGQTVTNTGPSVLAGSVGLSPGTSITGFPPGLVTPPATIAAADAVTLQAQSDLTVAYVNAAGRPLDATQTADLGGPTLQGGVYAGPSKGALSLTGPLVLDGAGDPTTVFIFQTDSTLTTASASTVTLINGAQECNVFWQVGSSATLGTGSVFSGNILALTSITVTTGVTVHGARSRPQWFGDLGLRRVHRTNVRGGGCRPHHHDHGHSGDDDHHRDDHHRDSHPDTVPPANGFSCRYATPHGRHCPLVGRRGRVRGPGSPVAQTLTPAPHNLGG
jgi:hypothetical protein